VDKERIDMKRKKPRVKYQGISFETPFIAEIKKHIMFNPKYRSIADFAREAIREKIARGENKDNIEERLTRLEKIIDEKCNERAETVKQYLERPLI